MRGALVAAVVCGASAAGADTVVALPGTTATLAVSDAWHRLDTTAEASLVVAYGHTSGARLAVTRAAVPNTAAWSSDRARKAAYADDLERGVRASVPGYRRRSRSLIAVGGVPGLDLEARRDDRATLVVRVLMFRTYALALAIEVPPGGALTAAREVARRFGPARD